MSVGSFQLQRRCRDQTGCRYNVYSSCVIVNRGALQHNVAKLRGDWCMLYAESRMQRIHVDRIVMLP